MNFTTDDGVSIYFEDSGAIEGSEAVIFAHEFAGEVDSWIGQVAALKSDYRCIAYAARGWHPSDVPEDPAAYTIERAVADMIGLLDHLGLEKAHLVGLSMGTNTVLQTALWHTGRCLSITLSSTGYGAVQNGRAEFQEACIGMSQRLLDEGWQSMAPTYGDGPFRARFKQKKPEAQAEFLRRLSGHSSIGSALCQRGVQATRPAFDDQEVQLSALAIPVLLIIGDGDQPGWAGTLFLKQVIPTAGLLVMPRTGHQTNLEEPELFNSVLANFLAEARAGTWGLNPVSASIF